MKEFYIRLDEKTLEKIKTYLIQVKLDYIKKRLEISDDKTYKIYDSKINDIKETLNLLKSSDRNLPF